MEHNSSGQNHTQPCQTCHHASNKYEYFTGTQISNLKSFYFFHNALLNNSKMVNISKRPMSMTKVATHLAMVGKAA